QVDHAVRAVRLAHADITELSSQLKSETDRLQDAAQIARAATQSVTRSLEHEREALGHLSQSLSVQSTQIIEVVDRQARMVADASDLAQTQLREAEASLAASTGSMIEVATTVSTTARTASEDLDRQTVRLETAGSGVADQIRSVEDGLSQQRAGLVSAALSLRADQEDFAVHIENQRAQLTEALSITRVATVDLGETSARGIDVLRDIVVSAQAHFQSVNTAAENERTSFETRIHATLSNISVMAADARDDLVGETRRALEQLNVAAEEARRAADQAAQSAQMRVDRLNESIFEAGKKADDVFDARFSTARRLIEDSAELISEAGEQTAQRLDASFGHTRQTIEDMNNVLNELSNGADQLPALAQARIAEIRKSVEDGIQAMLAAAQKAALETEAVDTAFQERVKRNYDMLTEAVRLMGVISGDQPLPQTSNSAEGTPPAGDRFRERDYGRTIGGQRKPAEPDIKSAAPRLRLSPLAAVTRPATNSPANPVPAKPVAPPPEGWSWRELLGGMEGRDTNKANPVAQTADQPPNDPEFDNLDQIMIEEVNAMGVDAASLLSQARIDEIAGAILA
ncbi:MAG: tipN, partial [Asticcacaulis sp.]